MRWIMWHCSGALPGTVYYCRCRARSVLRECRAACCSAAPSCCSCYWMYVGLLLPLLLPLLLVLSLS